MRLTAQINQMAISIYRGFGAIRDVVAGQILLFVLVYLNTSRNILGRFKWYEMRALLIVELEMVSTISLSSCPTFG